MNMLLYICKISYIGNLPTAQKKWISEKGVLLFHLKPGGVRCPFFCCTHIPAIYLTSV